jgi:hypothetical protein
LEQLVADYKTELTNLTKNTGPFLERLNITGSASNILSSEYNKQLVEANTKISKLEERKPQCVYQNNSDLTIFPDTQELSKENSQLRKKVDVLEYQVESLETIVGEGDYDTSSIQVCCQSFDHIIL